MFGFSSLIGGFVDKKSKEPTKEWGEGWDDGDEIDIDDEEEASPVESPVKPSKLQTIAQQQKQNGDKSNTFGMVSKFISAAGNYVTSESSQQQQQRKHDQQVMDLLLNENRQLRQLASKQSAEIEEIKEQQETLRLLEEETQDENEVLQFKVKSLEALVTMEKGNSQPPQLKLLDEMNAQKRELQKQVTQLQRELSVFKKMGSNQEDEDVDLAQAIQDLQFLYEQNAIILHEQDQTKLLAAMYCRDRPVIRYYREALFQTVAKKSLEQAEFLFKAMPPMSKEQMQLHSKMFIENKRLAADNGRLKKELGDAKALFDQEQEDRKIEEARHKQKTQRLAEQARQNKKIAQLLRQELLSLKHHAASETDRARKQIAPVFSQLTEKINLMARKHAMDLSTANTARNKAEQDKTNISKQLQQVESRLASEQRAHEQQLEQLHQSFEAQKAQVLDANSTSQFIDETELAMQKEVITHLQQQVEQLNERLQERETDLAEANEMVNHLEFESNRQFNHFSQEIKHKEELITQAQDQLRCIQQQNMQQQELVDQKAEEQSGLIEELQANYNYMVQQVNELQDQNQVLTMKLAHSPGSGLLAEQQTSSENLMQQLAMKNQQLSELMAKQTELEKMLEDKDDEIVELMQEIDKFQEEKSHQHEQQTIKVSKPQSKPEPAKPIVDIKPAKQVESVPEAQVMKVDLFEQLKQPLKQAKPVLLDDFFASLTTPSTEKKSKPEDLDFFASLSKGSSPDKKPIEFTAKVDKLKKSSIPFKLDLPGMETSELEKIFTTAVEKQKAKPKFELNFGELFGTKEETKDIEKPSRSHRRSRGQFDFKLEALNDGNNSIDQRPQFQDYEGMHGQMCDSDVQHVVTVMQRNQEQQIDEQATTDVLNISDLGADEPIQEPIQQNKWAHDLDILNEVDNSEEQSFKNSSTPQSLNLAHQSREPSLQTSTVQSSRNPSISMNEEGLVTSLHKQTNSEVFRAASDMLRQDLVEDETPERHQAQQSQEEQSAVNLDLREDFHSMPSNHSSPEQRHELVEPEAVEAQSSGNSASSSNKAQPNEEVQFSADNLIQYEENDGLANDTANFGSDKREESSDDPSPLQESAYFTRDAHVIKNASYGDLKVHDKIEQELKMRFMSLEDEHGEQSFAAQDPMSMLKERTSNDIEEGSDVLCQLDVMNSGDLLNFKDSLIEESNVNSLVGSLVQLEDADHLQELRLQIGNSAESEEGLPKTEHFEGQIEILDVGRDSPTDEIKEAPEHEEDEHQDVQGWASDGSLEIVDEDIDETMTASVVPALNLQSLEHKREMAQSSERSDRQEHEAESVGETEELSPDLLIDGWGSQPTMDLPEPTQQESSRSIEETFNKTLNLLSSLQDTRKDLKEFQLETQQKFKQSKLSKPEEPKLAEQSGWQDDVLDLDIEDALEETKASVQAAPAHLMCPNNHPLTEVNGLMTKDACQAYCKGKVDKRPCWFQCTTCNFKVCYRCSHCCNDHVLIKVKQHELGPLADEMLGFARLEETDILQAVCVRCEQPIFDQFWMCANLASSIEAASRGEDFLNPCKDVKIICVDCFSGKPKQFVPDDPDILGFLEMVKPKKKFNKPKLEIVVDESEGGTGGGWVEDNFDM